MNSDNNFVASEWHIGPKHRKPLASGSRELMWRD
jgi:hypothetical protein